MQRLKYLVSQVFSEETLPQNAAIIGAQVLFKLIASHVGRRGDMCQLIPHDADKLFALAAMQAYCNIRIEELYISDTDVHGGLI